MPNRYSTLTLSELCKLRDDLAGQAFDAGVAVMQAEVDLAGWLDEPRFAKEIRKEMQVAQKHEQRLAASVVEIEACMAELPRPIAAGNERARVRPVAGGFSFGWATPAR